MRLYKSPLRLPFFSKISSATMRRKNHSTLVSIFTTTLLFTTLSLYVFRNFFSPKRLRLPTTISHTNHHLINYLTKEDHHNLNLHLHSRHVSSIRISPEPAAILLPDWEVLIVASPENLLPPDPGFSCLFQNNATSPAKFTGVLNFSKRSTFKCLLPESVRRLRPLLRPILTTSSQTWPENRSIEIFRWSFIAYETLTTEEDVILFAKGVNNRQGINRSPQELRCIFDNGVNDSVKTAVTSSSLEVFRCNHPSPSEMNRLYQTGDERISISLEVEAREKFIVPSVTYYTPKGNIDKEDGKSLMCACTMVHNVGKFLKEWVIYYSRLGVEKFILYDNDSDDELKKVVEELVEENYNVETFLWPWAKTQEGGFSHSANYAKSSCTWMMYMDVDEFAFSPSWINSSEPSRNMLSSFLPRNTSSSVPEPVPVGFASRPIGQVSVRCLEYGPSNQQAHPDAGVTQGYTCRRRMENRHKSIVLLDVVDDSLYNVIHHFRLKDGYRTRTMRLDEAMVNHYKYQAWSEFKAKFRRRVSAYVVDWRNQVNPMSKDRTPGLGFDAVEPEGWATKFCERNDSRLKMLTQSWFSLDSPNGPKLAWQD